MTTPEQPGLLGGVYTATGRNGLKPEFGYLVTNHLNLMYMLAAGLVLPKGPFGEKYYRDTLDCCPGWIPLFVGKPWREAIDCSIAEAPHLKPGVLEIRLQDLSGPVMTLDPDGLQERRLPNDAGDVRLIFVPAPLPTSAIKSILFFSRDDLNACKTEARDFGNVPLADFTTRVDRKLLSKAPSDSWPPAQLPAERDAPSDPPQAAGGMMAMLRLLANRAVDDASASGKPLGVSACRLAFDFETEPASELANTVLAELAAWMRTGGGRVPTSTVPGIDRTDAWRPVFWGAVDTLAGGSGAAIGDSARGLLLGYLYDESKRIEGRSRDRIVKLRETLESLTGLADLTATDLFKTFSTPLPRAMSLLFLRSECADLLEFQNRKLTGEDWLAAAVLFGARARWLSLPLSLRGGPAASAAISHRMAAMSHRMACTGFELGPTPPRPKPLIEWFLGDWSPHHHVAALTLAKAQKWDCVQTRVKLRAGNYHMKVGPGGAEIVVPGEARAVETEVDKARFLNLLAGALIDPKNEVQVVDMLKD